MQEIMRIFLKFIRIDPDIIIHLAAVSHANKSNKDHNTFDNSLRTLENTLDFARQKNTCYLSVIKYGLWKF